MFWVWYFGVLQTNTLFPTDKAQAVAVCTAGIKGTMWSYWLTDSTFSATLCVLCMSLAALPHSKGMTHKSYGCSQKKYTDLAQ